MDLSWLRDFSLLLQDIVFELVSIQLMRGVGGADVAALDCSGEVVSKSMETYLFLGFVLQMCLILPNPIIL